MKKYKGQIESVVKERAAYAGVGRKGTRALSEKGG